MPERQIWGWQIPLPSSLARSHKLGNEFQPWMGLYFGVASFQQMSKTQQKELSLLSSALQHRWCFYGSWTQTGSGKVMIAAARCSGESRRR